MQAVLENRDEYLFVYQGWVYSVKVLWALYSMNKFIYMNKLKQG